MYNIYRHIAILFLDVFRQIDFGPDPEGHGRLNVFQLHSNTSYYLATTNLRHLELQVNSKMLCKDNLNKSFCNINLFCINKYGNATLVIFSKIVFN